MSLFAEKNSLEFAVPGGLIGVGTSMDPMLTRADRLVGQVLGDVGTLPDVFTELEINFFLLRCVSGACVILRGALLCVLTQASCGTAKQRQLMTQLATLEIVT